MEAALPMWNFYPRSPCGERLAPPSYKLNIHKISIHALLAESDGLCMLYDTTALIFLSTLSLRRATQWEGMKSLSEIISIHALLAESDARNTSIAGLITSFLSTLSLRRATCPLDPQAIYPNYFYPRSPCGERPMGLDGRFKL